MRLQKDDVILTITRQHRKVRHNVEEKLVDLWTEKERTTAQNEVKMR